MDFSNMMIRWWISAIDFMPRLLLIAILLVLTRVLARRAQTLAQRFSGRTAAPPEIGDLLGRMARVGVIVVGVLLVLDQLGLRQAALSFVAGLGIAGIVIGFAMQDIVKQFAAGVLLMMLRPFQIGDQVRISGFEGTVAGIQLRATVLRTEIGDEVLIPNADVYSTAIVNLSRAAARRRTVTLQVPRDADMDQVRATLAHAIGELPGVVSNPPPAVVGVGFDDAALKVELRFWIETRANAEATTTAVLAAARRVLERQGGVMRGDRSA